MADNQEQLGILIKAQDEASAILKNVSNQLGNLNKASQETSKGMTALSSGMGVAKTAAGVLLGMTGFAGISQAIGTMKGLLESSTKAYLDHDNAVHMVMEGLRNQKNLTEANVNALIQYSDARQRVTVFDNDGVLKMAALTTEYGLNVKQSEGMIAMAQDLASVQSGANATNEQAIGIAQALTRTYTTGLTRGLREFNIALTSQQQEAFKAAGSAERLKMMNDLLAFSHGAAARAAETQAGQIRIAQNKMEDLKKEIGLVSTTIMVDMIKSFDNASGGAESFGNSLLSLAKIGGEAMIGLAQMINGVAVAAKAMVWSVTAAGNAAASVISAPLLAGKTVQSNAQMLETLKQHPATLQRLKENGQLGKMLGENAAAIMGGIMPDVPKIDISGNIDAARNLAKEFEKIKGLKMDSYKAAVDAANQGPNAGKTPYTEELGKGAQAAATKLTELQTKVIDFKRKQLEVSKTIHDNALQEQKDLKDLKDQYVKDVADIQKSIDKLTKSYQEASAAAEDSFNKQNQAAKDALMGGILTAVNTAKATMITRANEIAGLQATGGDASKIANLQALQARDQAILDQHADDIAAAQKKEDDMKTALGIQALYDKYEEEKKANQKNFDDTRAKDLENYTQQKNDLQVQLADKTKAYKEANAKLVTDNKTTLQKIKDDYLQAFDDIAKALADFGGKATSLMNTAAVPAITQAALASFAAIQSSSLKKRASGGAIYGDQAYLVGEEGPEIVTGITGTVIPNNKAAGWGGDQNVTININVNNANDMNTVKDIIDQYLGHKIISSRAGIS